MLEMNILDKRWFNIIKDPNSFVLSIIYNALKELKIEHYEPNISIALADDDLLYRLNLRFRNISKPTNVLSFQCEQLSNKCDLGDIAVSIDTIQKESNMYNLPILTHVMHMLVHGLLHLLGYNHQNKKEEIIMKNLEIKILASLSEYAIQ
ncbi:MAG: rRNA maturation RNase YbeY [Wolbachia endosymbiont of Menacanthus eurysternus]|nr:MAG: rRNA maturation RNase YbeY [Wolbachia endosymbiont of Menacanthus eurysternus]